MSNKINRTDDEVAKLSYEDQVKHYAQYMSNPEAYIQNVKDVAEFRLRSEALIEHSAANGELMTFFQEWSNLNEVTSYLIRQFGSASGPREGGTFKTPTITFQVHDYQHEFSETHEATFWGHLVLVVRRVGKPFTRWEIDGINAWIIKTADESDWK
jgi:hypothetical protein